MALSRIDNLTIGTYFIKFALILLLSTLFFGIMGAMEYALPGFWRNTFSFEKIRPLHVSSAVFWILLGAVGSVLSFMQDERSEPLRHGKIIKYLFWGFSISFVCILFSYCLGIFGGREYWEFAPVFALPITICWIVFIFVFLRNLSTLKQQPVYIWMWFTGVLFFLFTYLESNLWIIPSVRDNLLKDMTIQWKSYGSLVGSWNLLIYGSSIYLMDKISGNKKYSYSNIAFAVYFLGLFNLMFNWGHHVYTLPTFPYVKHIAYAVSMTELILFGRIIYLWRSSLDTAKRHFHIMSYRFLFAADVWVFLTLLLAIPMSIPAVNIYMHGTHTIVGHTMGATIGINTMLLLAFAYDLLGKGEKVTRLSKQGFWIANISLFVFWLTLIAAGFKKSYWEFHYAQSSSYGEMIQSLHPLFILFFVSGIFLATGLVMVVIPLLKRTGTESISMRAQ